MRSHEETVLLLGVLATLALAAAFGCFSKASDDDDREDNHNEDDDSDDDDDDNNDDDNSDDDDNDDNDDDDLDGWLLLDGDADFGVASADSSLDLESFTIEGRFLMAASHPMMILTKETLGSSVSNYFCQIRTDLKLYCGFEPTSGSSPTVVSNEALLQSTWYEFRFAYDNASHEAMLRLNGQLHDTKTIGFDPYQNAEDLNVGRQPDDLNQDFEGYIDYIRIHDDSVGVVVAEWLFTADASDTSGAGNDLTLQGDAQIQ